MVMGTFLVYMAMFFFVIAHFFASKSLFWVEKHEQNELFSSIFPKRVRHPKKLDGQIFSKTRHRLFSSIDWHWPWDRRWNVFRKSHFAILIFFSSQMQFWVEKRWQNEIFGHQNYLFWILTQRYRFGYFRFGLIL